MPDFRVSMCLCTQHPNAQIWQCSLADACASTLLSDTRKTEAENAVFVELVCASQITAAIHLQSRA